VGSKEAHTRLLPRGGKEQYFPQIASEIGAASSTVFRGRALLRTVGATDFDLPENH